MTMTGDGDRPPKGARVRVRGITTEGRLVDEVGILRGWCFRTPEVDVLVDGKVRSYFTSLVTVTAEES
jgi:hypothetical protein